jgi:tetratricopeptide (TPR) repeat protein
MMKPVSRLLLVVLMGWLAGGCNSNFVGGENMRPRGVDVYVAGVKAYQVGDKPTAQARFEQATTINPELRMARSMLGDMYRAQGDYERARQQYEILVRLDPYGAENHYRLGVTYQFLQRLYDAIASYVRALDIQPRDMRASMNLGVVYLSLNQGEDAVKYLRKATELSPAWPDAWLNLGVALDAKGDLVGAEQAYKRALELNPNQSLAILNLAANLIRQKKGSEAVTVMGEAVKRVNDAPTRTRYGHALALANRFDDAFSQFALALQIDPRYYPALNERGYALITLYQKGLELDDKQRQQALEAWDQSLKIYPDQPAVKKQMDQWSGGRLFGTGRTSS